MTEHTPTPWKAVGDAVVSESTNARIADVLDGRPNFETDLAVAKANTAFIVQAVNSYYALRAALTTIAGFAVGNGDVCEIIARRAREALRTGGG